jgi:hypothetical protein
MASSCAIILSSVIGGLCVIGCCFICFNTKCQNSFRHRNSVEPGSGLVIITKEHYEKLKRGEIEPPVYADQAPIVVEPPVYAEPALIVVEPPVYTEPALIVVEPPVYAEPPLYESTLLI